MTCILCGRTFRAGPCDEQYCVFCKRDRSKAVLAETIIKTTGKTLDDLLAPQTILSICIVCGAVYKCPINQVYIRYTCSRECLKKHKQLNPDWRTAHDLLLTTPGGENYRISNLRKWVRENADKYPDHPNTMYRHLLDTLHSCDSWCGWTLRRCRQPKDTPGEDEPSCPTDART